jgi:hypothetical protein
VSGQSSTRVLAAALRRHAARSAATTGPLSRTATVQRAVVASLSADQTVVTTADGVPAIRLAAYAAPAVGDVIQMASTATGAWVALGRLAAATDAETGFTQYTPAVTGGTVTWSTRDGWWRRIAPGLTYVEIYLAASAAGSGGTLSIGLPSVPYRGTSNRRQVWTGYAGGLTAGTGPCSGLVLGSGSGAQIDQVQAVSSAAITGALCSATAIITISGLYREA